MVLISCLVEEGDVQLNISMGSQLFCRLVEEAPVKSKARDKNEGQERVTQWLSIGILMNFCYEYHRHAICMSLGGYFVHEVIM